MRSFLPAALLTLVALFMAGIMVALQNGAEMRGHERRAAANVEDIMLAQEEFRLARGNPKDGVIYSDMPALIDQQSLMGFTKTVEENTYAKDGYLFRVAVLPSAQPGSQGPRLGQRYQLWAWPQDERHISMVLYFGSSAGFLIQGENGEAAGVQAALPHDKPIQELDRSGDKRVGAALRWTVLKNIRDPANAGTSAVRSS